jgi:hypothetical protein
VTGYVDRFALEVGRADRNTVVTRIAQGGSHINSGGIVLLGDVLRNKPDVCFLDWHSTGLAKCRYPDQLNWVVFSLCDAGIYPVILVFPRKDRDQRRTGLFADACFLSKEVGLDILVVPGCDEPISRLLRDDVHTTELGSKYYSKFILEFCRGLTVSETKRRAASISAAIERRGKRGKKRFYTQSVALQANRTKQIHLTYDPQEPLESEDEYGCKISLLVEHLIGPFSPAYLTTTLCSTEEKRPLCTERGFHDISFRTPVSDIYSALYERKTLTVIGDSLWLDGSATIQIYQDQTEIGKYLKPLRVFVASNHPAKLSLRNVF